MIDNNDILLPEMAFNALILYFDTTSSIGYNVIYLRRINGVKLLNN
jgi:hypothetical protein